ncbi:MAG: SDR family NAD(P)-dependent oxidoreductase [Alkalispirochaeta sp.]
MNYYIVIGASRGVGAAIVQHLLAPDAVIIAVSRSESEYLHQLARKQGGTLHWLSRDLSDPLAADTLMEEIAGILGKGDEQTQPERIALFLSAAQLHPIGVAGTLTSSAVDAAVRLNLATPITVTQQFLRRFGELPCPIRAVLLSSGASQRVMPGLSVYGATKAAINAFVRSAQVEIDGAPETFRDVKLFAVSPGKVDTAMQDTLRAADAAALPERDEYRRWKDEGTLADPAEVARKLVAVLTRDDIEAGSYVHMTDL